MSERPTVAIPAEIQEAQLQFENWRRERKRGERIPENLWVTAVELAKQYGVSHGAGIETGAQPVETSRSES